MGFAILLDFCFIYGYSISKNFTHTRRKMSTIDTAVKVTTDNRYFMQIIWDEFDDNHNYDFSNRDRYPLGEERNSLDKVHDFITMTYLAGRNSLVAYRLFEESTVTEKTFGADSEGDVIVTRITITERTVETFFRTWADYEEKVIIPRQKEDEADEASGKKALRDAYYKETSENFNNRTLGIPESRTAYNAFQRFLNAELGYDAIAVPTLEEEEAEAHKTTKKTKKFFGLF